MHRVERMSRHPPARTHTRSLPQSHNRFDLVDRRAMAGRGKLGAPSAVEALQIDIAVIERGGEMCGGSAGFATAQRPVIDNDGVPRT